MHLNWVFLGGGVTKKRREKRWRREKRATVLILWRLSQTSSLPSSSSPLPATPPTLFLVLSFFPPVLQGIKTSIHAPEETHSRGEGGKKMRKRRGHQGRTVWGSQGSGPQPQICGGGFLCVFFFFSCNGFNQRFTISDLVATMALNAHSGKVWWECLETGPHSRLQHWDKHCSWICVELENSIIPHQISFPWYVPSLLGLIGRWAYRTFVLQTTVKLQPDLMHSSGSQVKGSLLHLQQ